MACAICRTRREKRHCPGIQGEICAICCGEQREETISCPLTCEYLQAAHERADHEIKDAANLPNPDVTISRDFLRKHLEILIPLQDSILSAALDGNAVDYDVREALEGLVRTYRTLESGLYYESRPVNPMAAGVFDAVRDRVAEIRKAEDERGMHKVRDSEILKILIFLHQMEYSLNNGRKRGRRFLSKLLNAMAHAPDPQQDPASLLVS